MPYEINQVMGGFEVVNTETGEVHAKHSTRAKAQAQVRLLNAVKHNPRFQPRGTRRKP